MHFLYDVLCVNGPIIISLTLDESSIYSPFFKGRSINFERGAVRPRGNNFSSPLLNQKFLIAVLKKRKLLCYVVGMCNMEFPASEWIQF